MEAREVPMMGEILAAVVLVMISNVNLTGYGALTQLGRVSPLHGGS
jgi:hypothetical protein